ncbi:MAG: hypothetical protein COT74_12115 [Bdellovibrionales bacterium CG10_big_fil_rev_8_21_14_0_10_45_34]|nr:MAG: hypothetical protein COT74_12115 [Bdellovibrionales bacterium CG10_big_fil_rev_8_21_14_0_10_45_34]
MVKETSPLNSGFTLIEVLIVLMILAAVTATIAPRLSSDKTKLQQAVRQMAPLARELRASAGIRGKILRLAVSFEKDKAGQYWVEAADRQTVIASVEQGKEEIEKQQSSDTPQEGPFALDMGVLKKVKELPKGLKFIRLELSREEQTIEAGMGYIYFFPEGLADEALLVVGTDEKLRWSIYFPSLSGAAEIFAGEKHLKDFKL